MLRKIQEKEKQICKIEASDVILCRLFGRFLLQIRNILQKKEYSAPELFNGHVQQK